MVTEAMVLWALTMASPTYTKDVRPIIMKRCTSCHTGQIESLPNFSKYEVAFAYKAKIMKRVVTDKNMPPGNGTGMTDAERALVKKWIDAGAKK